MDALEFRIKQAMTALIKKTLPDSRIPDFEFMLIGENKTFHGDYTKDKIRVGNLSREPRRVIASCIHQLAHHCEYHIYGETGHGDEFYKLYHALLVRACQMGIISSQIIKGGFEDETCIRKMEKIFGPILDNPVKGDIYKEDYCLISAFRSFHSREVLKDNGYYYNSRSKAWEKQIKKEEADKEKRHLIINGIQPFVTDDVLDITVFADIIITGNTYPERDFLKKHGYSYNTKIWKKRLKTIDIEKEKEVFDHLDSKADISYRIEY